MDAYTYQYSVGLLIFLAGVTVAVRHGYIGLSGKGLRNLLGVCGVLLVFLLAQGYLQYGSMEEAPAVPYGGGGEREERLGTPLDYGIMIGYFLVILTIGTWFGRRQRTLKDFFFGGQRFPWWMITFSLIATVVGSYSFVKYSQAGYRFGLGSAQTYLNDWLWLPLLIFGWLPILYFSRVTSIPEYFERRFDSRVRGWVTVFILVYLIGYVGVNLFTMGKVLNILLGWPIWTAAFVVVTISAIYVTAGGQTSVIMTDLFQGLMLLVTGVVLLFVGAHYMGGFDVFWHHLPRESRLAFPNFNEDPSFPSIGIFWQDGIANTAMFYFLNQGVIMRFLSARSVADGRKAMFTVVLVLMPVAAIVVGCGGWIARALVHTGVLPPDMASDEAFFVASELLSRPGMFGLILATLTAALMSTVDTLITAVAAIAVNDVYRPLIRPEAGEKELLKVARVTSVGVAVVGILMVPVFMGFKTIYEAHGAFTAAVTPPLVVTLMLAVFWRRFTRSAALFTLVGGMAAVVFSLFVPEVIRPFAHGVPMTEAGDGVFAGMAQFKFMRAFYGLAVCLGIGVVTTLFTRPEPTERQRGLVWGTIADAIRHYKGSPGREGERRRASALPRRSEAEEQRRGHAELPVLRLSRAVADDLEAKVDDLVYVTDRRWWLGGLRSAHAIIGGVFDDADSVVELGGPTFDSVVALARRDQLLTVERLY
ncbi:MAG: sodium/solute symporter [bacterium]|nr:sodium/solute symporter [bacterium]